MEVEQAVAAALAQRDRAGIAQPGVVVGQAGEAQASGIDPAIEHGAGAGFDFRVGHAQQHRLEAGHGGNQSDVGALDRSQARGPVGAGMRPGEDHARLRLPFGGESSLRRHARAQGCAGAGPISSSLALASTEFTTCEFSK
jgi:hypothetical protein